MTDERGPDDWQPEVDELRHRQQRAREMGGPDKVQRQRDAGRLTVRERLEALLDDGSFREIGSITGSATYDGDELTSFTPTNLVMGRGRIDGRTVVLAGDDFTVRGGAADASIFQKQVMAEQMAGELRLPLVRLVDGTGGGGSVKSLEDMGRTYVPWNPGWEHVVENLSQIPVVALGLGPVAGLGAARVATSHYAVLVEGTSQMFVAGPPVVAWTGENVDKETLGGALLHARNGAVDDAVDSEKEAFEAVRRFLSYLPSSVHELPARTETSDDPERREGSLIGVIPRDRRAAYKVRSIIDAVVDRESFFEMGRRWGRSVVTGFARLDGWPVALLASDPMHYGGGWTADASRKVERFVDLADTFHLPVVHLVDVPGFVIGTHAEAEATIRHGARALAAIYQASVPWCSIILRRVFGVAGAGHTNAARTKLRYAWPSGDWGSLPLEGGIEAAFKGALADAEDPAALRAQIQATLDAVRSPFRTAEAFLVEEIIDPRDTRPLLCEFANLAAPLRTPGRVARGSRP
jgi:acetyl-CoA carboxylase carboxyltransferase component